MPNAINDAQFLALYPLYRLAKQAFESGDPDFDFSMSRTDFMNGKNGIPQNVGMKCVFQLLLMSGDLVDMSSDGQSFRITPKGADAVKKFTPNREGLLEDAKLSQIV